MATVLIGFAAQGWAWADVVRLKDARREFAFSNGMQAVMDTSARAKPPSSAFHLRFYRDGQLLADYPGMAFDHLVASPDGRWIVGLSNAGVPGTAAAVFTADGALRLLASHNIAFEYCAESIRLLKQWYDKVDPNLVFDSTLALGGVSLRDCKGRQRSLLQILSDATQQTLEMQRLLTNAPR